MPRAGEPALVPLRGDHAEALSDLKGETQEPVALTIAFDARTPRLAIDPKGRPVVAWLERVDGNERVHVARWQDEAWLPLGSPLVADAARWADAVALAVGDDGVPVVAWVEGDPTADPIYVRRCNEPR